MKKAVQSLLILTTLLPFTLNAQTFLGFKAGMLTTPFIGYEDAKYGQSRLDYQLSFAVSGMYKEQVTQHFSIGANINYDYYRADYKMSWHTPTGGGGSKEVYYQFGYLGLYFYPQLSFGKKLSFYFNAGPYFGALINSFAEGDVTDSKSRDDLREGFIIAFITEIGLQYSIKNKWQITLNVSGKKMPCLISSPNIKNQIDLGFSLGFFYKISDKSKLNNKKAAPEN